MPPEQRLKVSEAFWADGESESQQAEALAAIARQLKFRVQTVQKLPTDRKIRYLASVAGVSDAVSGRALVVYHLACQRPMLRALLDRLGIAHEDGLISEEMPPLDQARLADAVAGIGAQFPAEDVRLYLGTLLAQDPDTWHGLEDLLEQS
jgi:hypothetical protein